MNTRHTFTHIAILICILFIIITCSVHALDIVHHPSSSDEEAGSSSVVSEFLTQILRSVAYGGGGGGSNDGGDDIVEQRDIGVTGDGDGNNHHNLHLRERVVTALENLVAYLSRHTRDMPVDTLYGIRGMEGMLQEIVSQRSDDDSSDLSERVRTLLRSVERLASDTAKEMSRGDQRGYYLQFKKLVDRPVRPLKPLELGPMPKPVYDPSDPESERRAMKDRRQNPEYSRHFDEDRSDVCLVEAINCRVTNRCLQMKELRYTTGYRLTHQVLYYLYLWQRCQVRLTAPMLRTVAVSLRELTANMHAQYKLDRKYSDLWVERVLFGIMTGYHELFLSERLVQYLVANNLNTRLGCWSDEDGVDVTDKIPNDVYEYEPMRDNDIGDGCSFHTSGIVGWILAAYLRYH